MSSSSTPIDANAILTAVEQDIIILYRSSVPMPWSQAWFHGMNSMCAHLKYAAAGCVNLITLDSFIDFMKTMNEIFQNMIPSMDPVTFKNRTLGERVNLLKSIIKRMKIVFTHKKNSTTNSPFVPVFRMIAPRQEKTTTSDFVDVDIVDIENDN